jgi:hypothetical protein
VEKKLGGGEPAWPEEEEEEEGPATAALMMMVGWLPQEEIFSFLSSLSTSSKTTKC